jgi:hypothetical protein
MVTKPTKRTEGKVDDGGDEDVVVVKVKVRV